MAKVKVYVCNFDDLNINSLSKLNWLPYCIDNVQWYVAEVSTFNSQTLQESTPIKIYKQGADGSITTTQPTGTVIKDGYCKNITLSENSSQNRITGVIANGASVNVNPSFNTARDVTIYNSKDVTLVFEYSSTVNSTLHRVNIPAGSTWSNTLKRDDYSDEGFYLTANIIAQYGSTLANGEVNINWTT